MTDAETVRKTATSSLRWIALYVRLARQLEASGDAIGARLAWLGAWYRAEWRARCEQWGRES